MQRQLFELENWKRRGLFFRRFESQARRSLAYARQKRTDSVFACFKNVATHLTCDVAIVTVRVVTSGGCHRGIRNCRKEELDVSHESVFKSPRFSFSFYVFLLSSLCVVLLSLHLSGPEPGTSQVCTRNSAQRVSQHAAGGRWSRHLIQDFNSDYE